MVSGQDSEQGEGLPELSEELEEELCKVWDMAMDKVHLITIDIVYIDSIFELRQNFMAILCASSSEHGQRQDAKLVVYVLPLCSTKKSTCYTSGPVFFQDRPFPGTA